MQRALSVFRDGDLPIGEQLRWLFVATRCAIDIWDDESWRDLAIRQVELARAAGALSLLPFAITQRVGCICTPASSLRSRSSSTSSLQSRRRRLPACPTSGRWYWRRGRAAAGKPSA